MEERFNEENFFCCRHAPRDFLRGREKDPETGIQYLFPQLASEDVFNGYVGCGEFEELYYPDEVEGE